MQIENAFGKVEFDMKFDLNEEEGSGYLSQFYRGGVMELKFVEAALPGGGSHLMREFLSAAQTLSSGLIFLDCSPLFIDGDESDVMQRLHNFYERFGFRGKTSDGYSRMWRIQKLPGTLTECFDEQFDAANDLHWLLQEEFLQSRATTESVDKFSF